MASPQLSAAQQGLADRSADQAHAVELQRLFPAWQIFPTRNGRAYVATRIGAVPPPGDDDVWSASLIADRWIDLEAALVLQVEHDAELVMQEIRNLAAQHPEVSVSPPDENLSSSWQLHYPGNGGSATCDSPARLLACLRSYHTLVSG